jgi:hypothetical protein
MTHFHRALRDAKVRELGSIGVFIEPDTDLKKVLHTYFTVKERQIEARARTVHRSPEFDMAIANLLDGECDAAVAIVKKLTLGEDVNGHLSLRSLRPETGDELLVDWGIHHMHLGLSPHSSDQRFLERSVALAFAHVTETDAYLLTIMEHGRWTDQVLFEILVRRFPDAASKFELVGVAPDPSVTEEVIAACRKLGVVYVVSVDGKSYRPTSFAGVNLSERAFQRSERTVREVTALESMANANIEKIRAGVPALYSLPFLDLEPCENMGVWMIRERTTGQIVNLQPR